MADNSEGPFTFAIASGSGSVGEAWVLGRPRRAAPQFWAAVTLLAVLLACDTSAAGGTIASEAAARDLLGSELPGEQLAALEFLAERSKLEPETLRLTMMRRGDLDERQAHLATQLLARHWDGVAQVAEAILQGGSEKDLEIALTAIAALGGQARSLLSRVVGLQTDPRVPVANAAAYATEQIGPATPLELESLVEGGKFQGG